MHFDTPSPEWLEQRDHERTRAWMQAHGWSCSLAADPADVYEILVSYDPDADDDDDQENALNQL